MYAAPAPCYGAYCNDEYLIAQVMLPHRGESARTQVKTHKHDAMGKPIGKKAPGQPMLDTRMYKVMFPDSLTEAVIQF